MYHGIADIMKQEEPKTIPESRKKVLFLITKANWGGAQRYVYDLATHLPKDRFEAIVAFGSSGKLSADLAISGIPLNQISALARDVSFASDIKSFFQIWKLLRGQRPDVLHLNSSKAAALGAFAGRLSRVPRIIFTVHGWPFKEDRGGLATAMIRVASWLTALLSDVVIVVSKEDERIGKAMWGLHNKIYYVPLGITIPEFVPRDQASLILTPWIDERQRIVTIAELTPNKGIRFGLEAMMLLKEYKTDISYFIIGDGEERDRLIAQTEAMQISDRVHFLGFVPDAGRYLQAFDIFLLPSIKEGMPYVLLEAGMAGLPIVSTNVVDPMFFKLSPNIIPVDPAHPQALADAILKVLHPKTRPVPPLTSSLSDMVDTTIELYTTAPTISVSSRA